MCYDMYVEEEMLMHKFYELTKQAEHQNIEVCFLAFFFLSLVSFGI